jgi:hypothetical protein
MSDQEKKKGADMERHQGIRIDRIPVSGALGLVFAIGMLVIGLIALPAYREFLLVSFIGGGIGAVILLVLHRYGR